MSARLSDEQLAARISQVRAIEASVPSDKVVRGLLRLFELEPDAEPDEFTFPASTHSSRERIFGGQIIAQAMIAASRTVDAEKQVHSLHAYFLRGGSETLPLHFRVHRDFDGRAFSNRRVVVRQEGKVIFNLTASFQKPEGGVAHQVEMPDLLPPEKCWDHWEMIAHNPEIPDAMLEQMMQPRPFELRSFRPPPEAKATNHYQWFRLREPFKGDQLHHRALLSFASDMGLLSSAMLPHGLNWVTPGLFSTSLDHAMWFHNDVQVDEWFVYVMDSDWTGGGRGINHGWIYRQDGTLVASVVQEGLIRLTPPA
ncbi:MAG: acyl-CoA thioesterase domain-containing protein [Sphingorhabdus sp.]